MATYKAKPFVDPLTRQAIETQKRAERAEERRLRFLHHPKQRQYGIDSQFLDTQVADKAAVAQQEQARNAYYDDLTVFHANQIKSMERDRQAAAREKNEQIEKFRLLQIQERDAARAAKANAKDLGDLPTDFLNFQGEDLDREARIKAMQVQQQDWYSQPKQTCFAPDAVTHGDAQQNLGWRSKFQ